MSSVNRQSVREEAERIKAEFSRITANKKVDAEINMLIQSMLMLINLLIAIFLEKTTKKHNKNSSKPSSQTEKDESSTTNSGTNGKGLKAYIINLLVCQMISLNRVQKMIKSIIGETIAEASLLKFILRLHLALEQWEASSIEQILKSTAMHVDETSLRVDKKNYWIHVYSAGDITLKLLHQKRGKQAIEDIRIIPRYSGTIIHDCWASYLAYDHCDHGLCGSHIVRELTCIIESNGYKWAYNMKALLLETCKTVSKRKKKRLSKKQYANLQKRYRNIITRGDAELPPIPKKPNGKRGKMAKSDAHNLLERLKDYESSVLLFAKKSDVAFTNNRAERDLRMSKVKQKVSGCFRKELYAKAYCRISSYLQTMANRGHNPLIAIQMALAGEIIS